LKVSDAEILVVPDAGDVLPGHWLSRWEAKLSTARRIRLQDGALPTLEAFVGAIVAETTGARRPVVFIAQGLGVLALVHAAPLLRPQAAGAFLVGPPDFPESGLPASVDPAFLPVPRSPLPFPSLLVASRNDPRGSFAVADDLANAWGSAFVDAGEAGSLSPESGHGPWPEGLTRFATLMARL
jgi:predicted alpha/beta hydrolase family esterase